MTYEYENALPLNFTLQEYGIETILGAGGFGITYRAQDSNLEIPVAIKEYLPADLAVRKEQTSVVPKSTGDQDFFQWGLQRFLDEARTLARFDHPNIVRIRRFFEANGTAYMVMDYEAGETLEGWLGHQGSAPSEAALKGLFVPVLDGLRAVHEAGLLHRDIKPENIYIRTDGRPMLIDFGAARQALGERSRSLSVVVSEGYAPKEQYASRGNHGPWSDIYGLGASLYRCLSGHAPPGAMDRAEAKDEDEPDPLTPAVEIGRGRYSEPFLQAIDAALAFLPKDRPQTVRDFQRLLAGETGEGVAEGSASQPAPPPAGEQAGHAQHPQGHTHNSAGVAPSPPQSTPARGFNWQLLWIAVVLVVLVGGGVGLWQWRLYQEAQQQALRQQEAEAAALAEREAERARQAAEARQREREAQRQRQAELAKERELERQRQARLANLPQLATLPQPEMVAIPGGIFQMGDLSGAGNADEKPVHRVIVGPFSMSAHEVTVSEFAKFIEATDYRTEAEQGDGCYVFRGSDWEKDKQSSWQNPGFAQGQDHPVVCVTWNDAMAYVEWLSEQTGERYRLPSEAEWEYAARAGSTSKYHFGNDEAALCDYANGADKSTNFDWRNTACDDGFGEQTAPVGSFQPNVFGLYDMHGNVYEWTQDCWNDSYAGAPADGSAWTEGNCGKRVVRGGSWGGRPRGLRAADRAWFPASFHNGAQGFRLAQDR